MPEGLLTVWRQAALCSAGTRHRGLANSTGSPRRPQADRQRDRSWTAAFAPSGSALRKNAPDRPENLNFLLENNTGTSFRSHAWFPALPK
jgi:hypothetical protein